MQLDSLGGGVVTIYPGASASKVESLVTKPIEEVTPRARGGPAPVTSRSASRRLDHRHAILGERSRPRIRSKGSERSSRISGPSFRKGSSTPLDVKDVNAAEHSRHHPLAPGSFYGSKGLNSTAPRSSSPGAFPLSSGVGGVEIEGVPERQIQVDVDGPAPAARYVIPFIQIHRHLVRGENAAVPGGPGSMSARAGTCSRTRAESESLDDISRTVIGSCGNCRVHLRDVAASRTAGSVRYKARTNGAPALLLASRPRMGSTPPRWPRTSAPSSRT